MQKQIADVIRLVKRPRIKENDYLHLSARIRVMENRLLSRDKLERMLDANTAADAAKVLTECGYRELGRVTAAAVEELLAATARERFEELEKLLPDPRLLDVFRVKYDYHNMKVLLKAGYMGTPAQGLLSGGGRYAPETLTEALSHTNAILERAAAEAGEVLSSTGDGQRADFILDAACYQDMLHTASSTGSEFLVKYVRTLIDVTNLRTCVRARRMGMELGPAGADSPLLEGGSVDPRAILHQSPDLKKPPLDRAAQAGYAAMEGGSLTAFERACDDAVTAVVREARGIPFGEQPVVAYLYAREAEETAIRVILSGKLAGLDRATLAERVRESYV